ncbi:hypothetical protein [Actinocorallia lasiicapitis]
MGGDRGPLWLAGGDPKTVVLYRTSDRWRYAICFARGDILDGFLQQVDVSDALEEAQSALRGMVKDLIQRDVQLAWQPADELDWWTGVVVEVEGIEQGPNL